MRAATLLLIFTILGFVFLYAPILSLIVFSFNESKLVTVWGGFSTKWYGELLRNPQILGAAWISLKVAVALGHARRGARDARRLCADPLRPVPLARAADRHVDGAARHARGDHRPVAPPPLRVDGAADRLAARAAA